SDGTAVTQNGVPPGGKYLYKFKAIRPGIFWYHPHHHNATNQVFHGLYGSIVVTDPNEATLQANGTLPPQSQTKTMVLGDTTVGNRAGSPYPGDASFPPGTLSPTASTLSVRAGQGIRFQFVDAAAVRYFRLLLADGAGRQIPLVRVGGEGGLLDNAVVEGGQ